MRTRIRRAYPFAAIAGILLVGVALPFSGVFASKRLHAASGNSLNAPQPGPPLSEAAKKALLEASEKLPQDPYAWYNLGLVYKDIGEHQKAIEAFEHVTQIAPSEPDAFYFIGYLNTQLQKYDTAIAAFQSALSVFPFHASAEFGLARAYQRKGDGGRAREHLQKFQKITSQHLGTPFGAGYGDQGKFSLAEYSKNALLKAPAAIPVTFAAQSIAPGASSGA